MSVQEIAEKLEAAGCIVKVWNDARVYVHKIPNYSESDHGYAVDGYGYCIGGYDDIRDTIASISKRYREIHAILAA